jgi:glycosyltransferase involved in cell wall biosynthesis
MKVSIIVPLYNKGRWIRRALDSIARQTFTDFEVIVVNDGSTDDGPDVVASYCDARFRMMCQLNTGPGSARNRGITEAKGELLAFLDADDEWFPNYLEDSIKFMDSFNENVVSVSSGYVEYPSGLSRQPMWQARGIKEGAFRLTPSTDPLLAAHCLAYMSPCSTVMRASILRRWGGFYDRDRCLFGEDAYLCLKLLLNETVSFCLTPAFRYHCEASGLAKNHRGARPVEPFLLDPSGIEAACPLDLRILLSRILAIRAFKTACMLGYWGQWQTARSLLKRYYLPEYWKLPYFLPAMVCSTPAGAILGEFWRAINIARHDRLT